MVNGEGDARHLPGRAVRVVGDGDGGHGGALEREARRDANQAYVREAHVGEAPEFARVQPTVTVRVHPYHHAVGGGFGGGERECTGDHAPERSQGVTRGASLYQPPRAIRMLLDEQPRVRAHPARPRPDARAVVVVVGVRGLQGLQGHPLVGQGDQDGVFGGGRLVQ